MNWKEDLIKYRRETGYFRDRPICILYIVDYLPSTVSIKAEAMETNRMTIGNSERNVLKAKAAAYCVPNFFNTSP
ncbi:MAG TPA: hypothetical protein VK186_14750 [Candidatus Deferrimicrobium sp.]|nr:hypothetical protein [Candidatus Kapabacteria bacterium]HLP60096.1 hypothetical protein [Candidatus Deferrimicrobium sp.]